MRRHRRRVRLRSRPETPTILAQEENRPVINATDEN